MQNWIDVDFYDRYTGETRNQLINLSYFKYMKKSALPNVCVFQASDESQLYVKEDYQELKARILQSTC